MPTVASSASAGQAHSVRPTDPLSGEPSFAVCETNKPCLVPFADRASVDQRIASAIRDLALLPVEIDALRVAVVVAQANENVVLVTPVNAQSLRASISSLVPRLATKDELRSACPQIEKVVRLMSAMTRVARKEVNLSLGDDGSLILRVCERANASSFSGLPIAHSHPSGVVRSSQEDDAYFRQHGLGLHLIVGPRGSSAVVGPAHVEREPDLMSHSVKPWAWEPNSDVQWEEFRAPGFRL